jgi:hypothetical protein
VAWDWMSFWIGVKELMVLTLKPTRWQKSFQICAANYEITSSV